MTMMNFSVPLVSLSTVCRDTSPAASGRARAAEQSSGGSTHLGVGAHEPLHRAGREAFGIAGQAYGSHARDNVFNHMDANPGVLQVLTCPSLVAAVGSLLGPDWAIVPYANSTIEADAGDQHWHK